MPKGRKDNRTVRLTPQKGDVLAMVFVLALAALSLFAAQAALASHEAGAVAVISMNGEEIRRIDLSSVEGTLDIPIEGAYAQTVRVENGRICMLHSECPGNNCVAMGWASDPAHIIVCLPNRVEITVLGESDADMVIG